jgi:hypothetical protein
LKEHVKVAHPEYFAEGPIDSDRHLSQALGVLSCFGELFTYFKDKRDGRYYVAVQLISTSNEPSKYKYKCTLRATNGVEKISKTFLVHRYSEDFETIFKSGKCLNLDEETVNYFLKEKEVEIVTQLSKV